MAVTKYCLSWDSYENNICTGLAKLQESEEFVDMTLVASGHLVKVHKNLLALASPYLKQIIQTAPCEHPIIFFSNINHEILCYILEYIYTGQTQVEVEKLQAFLSAAEELKLPSFVNPFPSTEKNNVDKKDNIKDPVEKEAPVLSQSVNNESDDADMPVMFENHTYSTESTSDVNNININDLIQINNICNPIENEIIDDNEVVMQELNDVEKLNKPIVVKIDPTSLIPQQYTVSNRGSLQLILNRYIYSCHHQALQGRKRRWRCIEYRLRHCQAYIDTLDDNITKRKNIHSHPYHDHKIMKKRKANLIFETINTAIRTAKEFNSLKNAEKFQDSE